MYQQTTKLKFDKLTGKTDTIVLGIESSCDETAAAVVRGQDVLSSVIASQAAIHQRFGGVVPEVASRNHTLDILPTIEKALKNADLTLSQIDAIAVTYAPGLIGSLLVGVSTAKALSLAHNIPLIKVDHIQAHICACFAANRLDKGQNNFINPKTVTSPPLLAIVASGGHTSLISVPDHNTFATIASTPDDAIGEAFDKIARILGLPYPGGPEVDKLSKSGSPNIVFFKNRRSAKDLFLSYSGLKTAVVNYVHSLKMKGEPIPTADICASFNKQAADMLIKAALLAAKDGGHKKIALCGGVAANSYLRDALQVQADGKYKIIIPPLDLCGDNAIMIALRGYFSAKSGKNLADLSLNAASISI
ncbi:MAG: tRNA (adenosine(37)-N6)-threonylcarbamoyltransferase complex transferase subunit TsaD [Firmicutes bacterium]|nr:tRNA (adenosine(37)-N6)-threonylcarbamoyltransferase complex transferase subunit TsaD [Bacillota bacterium]